MNITTRNAYLAISALEPFKAGALRGEMYKGEYRVYSYCTVIASHTQTNGWEVNNEKYSVTTSRHQSQVRRAVTMMGA